MSPERTFIQHEEIALRAWGTDTLDHGRMTADAPIVLEDLDDPAQAKSGSATFSLMTAGDVSGLVPGSITRRFPSPGSSDAEQPKAALIEFAPADLPWRYTPGRPGAQVNAAGNPGQGLKPWLVLVVGEPTELSVAPDGTVEIATSVQQNHRLDQSWMWAHVQHVDGHDDIGRIISPFELSPDTLYLACLVPGFAVTPDEDVAPAWNGNAEVRLP